MSMIEAVKAWLESCPLLEGERIAVDYLAAEPGSWAIDVTPVQPIIKRYINGATQRQYSFDLAAKRRYGDDIAQNSGNLELYEQLAAWLSAPPFLPDLGAGKRVQKSEVVSSGFAAYADTKSARYQISCRIIYIQEA